MTKLDGTELILDFLKGLPPKQAAQIAKKVLALGVDPRPPDSQKLSGYDFFRVDFGEYRIVYELDSVDDVVRLILIGKRNDNEFVTGRTADPPWMKPAAVEAAAKGAERPPGEGSFFLDLQAAEAKIAVSRRPPHSAAGPPSSSWSPPRA